MYLLVLICGRLHAQVDPHFSQYYIYPSWLNPALTGAFDGAYRVSGIYRSQWGNLATPFTTSGVSGEFTTEKNINAGVSLLRQTAGDAGYSYTTAYGNVAYTGVRFGKEGMHRLHLGLQFGLMQRRFDRSKLTFGDQWNTITGYNPGSVSAATLTRTSAGSFDAGAGAMYFDATPDKKANVFAGFSVSHMNGPSDQFSSDAKAKIPVRYTLHGGVRFNLDEAWSLLPQLLYSRQGNAAEKMTGVYAQYKTSDNITVMGGVHYRWNDAIAPYIGFTHKGWILGACYDVNRSDLGKVAGKANSFEITLSFIGRKKITTPQLDFVCPGL